MFYNELSAKYLFWTCQGIHSVFFRFFRNYHVAVSTCISHNWRRYIVSLLETRTPFHVFYLLLLLKLSLSPIVFVIYFENLGAAIFKRQFSKPSLLYLVRSPAKKAENSCGNNCWMQHTNKFNQNKFYRRCWTKGRYRTMQLRKISLDSDCKGT